MRQVTIRLPSELLETSTSKVVEGNAVDIVIAEDDQGFFAFTRLKKSIHGSGHVGQEKGVREIFEARLEEVGDRFGFAEAAIHEALGEQRRDFQGVGQRSGQERLWRGDCPTEFHFKRFTADYADERGLKTKMNVS